MDRVIRRFAKIWAATDPPAVKFMRRTGSLIELPLKAADRGGGLGARNALRRAGRRDARRAVRPQARGEPRDRGDDRLHQQAARARALVPCRAAAGDAGRGGGRRRRRGRSTRTPPCWPAQERLRQREFTRHSAVRPGPAGRDRRHRRATWRASCAGWPTISAAGWGCGTRSARPSGPFLNVLPAAAAVTYVLSTGDPVGGATIKVKLAGLFGLKDLYALVAIPVTRGHEAGRPEAAQGHARARSPRPGSSTSSRRSGRCSSRRSPAILLARPSARPGRPSA
ncbi:MAG: hypothetical protein MZV70_03640 [Desulfobacterales bacterium]|nr:hypothetical protein [Desulfobacterales bacterium]